MMGSNGWGRAALAAAVLVAASVGPALGQDIGDMARKTATALESMPLVLQIVFYVVGFTVLGIGLYKLIQNKQTPGGGSVGVALLWMAVGA